MGKAKGGKVKRKGNGEDRERKIRNP